VILSPCISGSRYRGEGGGFDELSVDSARLIFTLARTASLMVFLSAVSGICAAGS